MTLGHPPGTTNSIRYKALFIPQHVHEKMQTINQSSKFKHKKDENYAAWNQQAWKGSPTRRKDSKTDQAGILDKFSNCARNNTPSLYQSHSKRRRPAAPEICLTCVHPLAYNSLFKQLCIKGGNDSPLYKRKQRLREVKLQVKGYTARK